MVLKVHLKTQQAFRSAHVKTRHSVPSDVFQYCRKYDALSQLPQLVTGDKRNKRLPIILNDLLKLKVNTFDHIYSQTH